MPVARLGAGVPDTLRVVDLLAVEENVPVPVAVPVPVPEVVFVSVVVAELVPDDVRVRVDDAEGVSDLLAPSDKDDVGDPVMDGVTVGVKETVAMLVTDAEMVPVPEDEGVAVCVGVGDEEMVEEVLAGVDGECEGLTPIDRELEVVPDGDGVFEFEPDTVDDAVPETVTVSELVPVTEPVPVGVNDADTVVEAERLTVGVPDGVSEALAPMDTEAVLVAVLEAVTDGVLDCDKLLVVDDDGVCVGEGVDEDVGVPEGVACPEIVDVLLGVIELDGVSEELAPCDSEDVGDIESVELADCVGEMVSEPVGADEPVPEDDWVGVRVPVIVPVPDVETEGVSDGSLVMDGVSEPLAPLDKEAVPEAVPEAVTVCEPVCDGLIVVDEDGVCVGEGVDEDVGVPEGVACPEIVDVLLGVIELDGVSEELAPCDSEDVGDIESVELADCVGEMVSEPVGADEPVPEDDWVGVREPVIELVPDLVIEAVGVGSLVGIGVLEELEPSDIDSDCVDEADVDAEAVADTV